MRREIRLPMYEEILLLALHDDKGTTDLGSMHTSAMGGAILSELVMAGAVTLGSDGKKPVRAVPAAKVADPILAECLALIQAAGKPRKAAEWVMKFAGLKDLKNRAARQLVDKGVLRESQDKVLGLFRRTIYPESDPGPEKELRDRLYWVLFRPTTEVETRTVAVAALLNAAGMLPGVFGKQPLKKHKERVKKVTSGQVVGAATREAVEAVQAAVLVATMVPVITAAT